MQNNPVPQVIVLTPEQLTSLVTKAVSAAVTPLENRIEELQYQFPLSMSQSDFAKRVDVNPKTVQSWVKKGLLRLDSTRRITRQEATRFANDRNEEIKKQPIR